jgi:NADH-quinone oxidoreductase subunit E
MPITNDPDADGQPRADAGRESPSQTPRLLSDLTRQKIRKLVDTYPERRTALLPALKLAQLERGYLPPEVVAETADLVGVPHPAAFELVAFYNMLHAQPEGATLVTVCDQLPCALRGAGRLLRQLAEGLGIQPGQTTPDRAVTLERTSECFGACHRAPMARVNDEYVEQLDPAATQRLLERLRQAGANGQTRVPDGAERARIREAL